MRSLVPVLILLSLTVPATWQMAGVAAPSDPAPPRPGPGPVAAAAPFAAPVTAAALATWPDDRALIRVDTGWPGARVRLVGRSSWDGEDEEHGALADGEGIATLRLPADELRVGWSRVHVSAPGCVPQSARVPESGIVACRVSPGIALEGIVLGPDGRPRAGARVLAIREGREGEDETGPDGRFAMILDNPPGRPSEVSLRVDHPDHPPRIVDVGARDRSVEIVLARGNAALGRLVFPDGSPVAGLTVSAAQRTAVTDKSGRFSLLGLTAGRHPLGVGQIPCDPSFGEIRTGGKPARIVLRKFVLDVRVVDAEGRSYDKHRVARATTTGASMRILGPHPLPLILEPGRKYYLSASVPGVGRAGIGCQVAGEPGLRLVTLVLEPDPYEAMLRVRDAAGGVPTAVRVRLYPERGLLPVGRVVTLDADGRGYTQDLWLSAGRARFEPAGGFSRSGYLLPVEMDLEAASPKRPPVEILFPIGGRLRVLVRRRGEGVVPPCGLVLRDAAGKPVGAFVQRRGSGQWSGERSAAKEAFLRDPVPPGVYTILPSLAGPPSHHRRVRIEAGKTTAVCVSTTELR